MKSPLRYPGGKSRAVNTLYDLIQHHLQENNTTNICSPFIGGGSFEIFLGLKGYQIHGYDIFTPLVEFWQCMLVNPNKLATAIEVYHDLYEVGNPSAKDQFYDLQKTQQNHEDKWHRAAIFFTLNRSSFSGSTLSGGWSPDYPRFNEASINRVRDFKLSLLSVRELSFDESIVRHPDDFLYLDPPYLVDHNLYGNKGSTHKNFNHILLHSVLSNRNNWLMSYNDDDEIRELYKDYRIEAVDWAYGMTSSRKSNEIVIFSDDIEKIITQENISNKIFNDK